MFTDEHSVLDGFADDPDDYEEDEDEDEEDDDQDEDEDDDDGGEKWYVGPGKPTRVTQIAHTA